MNVPPDYHPLEPECCQNCLSMRRDSEHCVTCLCNPAKTDRDALRLQLVRLYQVLRMVNFSDVERPEMGESYVDALVAEAKKMRIMTQEWHRELAEKKQ